VKRDAGDLDSWRGRRVLVATSEPAHPVANGGIQASAHDLLVGLADVLGADALLLSAAGPGDYPKCRRRLEQLGLACVEEAGELHYRPGPRPGSYGAVLTHASAVADRFEAMLRDWQPELIVAQAAGWRDVVSRSRAAGLPVVHWLHGWLGLFGDMALPEADLLLANSDYTAAQVGERFGLRPLVFEPPVEPGRVRAGRPADAGGAITMINPLPAKGIEIFLALARRFPERRFITVDCWGTAPEIARAIGEQRNIEHLPARETMREVYAQTALLVVPTTDDETFGRVVVEAQLNGIPVLASDRGALPNVVGSGGQVLDVEAALDDWVAAVDALTDPGRYREHSQAALRNAARFDFPESIRHFARLVETVGKP